MRIPSLAHWKTSLVQTAGTSPLGKITLAGTISKSRGIRRDEPRVFGQWAIVYLVAGSGNYHDARGIDVPLRAGDVILVFPEVAHSYGPEPGGIWNELYVCFRGPVFESWRDAELFDVRNPVFHWKAPRIGLEILQPFFSKLNQPGQSMLEAVTMWQQILSRIFAPRSAKGAREHRPAWFLQAVDLLERAAADDEKCCARSPRLAAWATRVFEKNSPPSPANRLPAMPSCGASNARDSCSLGIVSPTRNWPRCLASTTSSISPKPSKN